MTCKSKGWYQSVAKWIGKTKNWYQVAAKCICKNKDWFQVADSWIGKIIQRLIQEQVYTNLFKLSFGRFLSCFKFHAKKAAKWQFKKICVYLLLYQSLYDLPNPTVCNLKSVLVCIYKCTWPQLDISSWSYQSTWPQTDISPCSYKPSQVPGNTLDSTLLGRAFFLFSILLVFVSNHPLLKYLW